MEWHTTAQGKRAIGGAVIVLSALILAWCAQRLQVIEEIENRSWDWRVRMTLPYRRADPRIKVIVIDQAALDTRALDDTTWPWPRSLYVPVIKFLERAGAKAVAFDLLFTESSAHSHFEDLELAEAAGGALPVVMATVLSESERDTPASKLEIFRRRQTAEARRTAFGRRFLAGDQTRRYRGITLPIVELLERAAGFGNVTAESDSDGVYRHYVPGGTVHGIPVLGLPFALFDIASGAARTEASNLDGFFDRRGRLTVNFNGTNGAYEMININAVINSYSDLLESKTPQVDPQRFRDSFVFVGTIAPALMDLRPTPVAERYNGVEYNATVLDNLLHGNFVRKCSAAAGLLYTALFVGLVAALVLMSGASQHHVVTIGGAFLLFFMLGYVLTLYGYWMPMAIPLAGMLMAVVGGLALQYQLEGRQHRFIKSAFRYYVSPSVIDKIVEDPRMLSLGGEKRELTLFFSDIAGFTSISERIEPTKLVPLINTFLSEMTDIILRSGGTVDKYVGDAIVAFWNAPVLLADHAERAVKASLDCQRRLAELGDHFQKEFGVALRMRVGLNTGVVTVGNFGSRDRFNYTVIGDAANLASRLEGANKYFGTAVLFAASTHKALGGNVRSRKVADIKVVGKSEVVTIYEPIGNGGEGEAERFAAFEQALRVYEGNDLERALELFMAIPRDPVARVYITRVQRDLARRSAGDQSWSSVWNLTEK